MNLKKKIAISLVNLNGFEYLQPAITSLINSDINNFDFKLFYWDNGSSDDSLSFIKNLKIDKMIIESDENLGIIQPRINLMNEILNEKKWDAVLEIHSDMLFPLSWFRSLIGKFTDQTGILMPYIIQQKKYLFDLNILNQYIQNNKSEKLIYNCIAVHPWLLNIKCIQDIGYYNPIYKKHRCEDDDLMFRVLFSKYDIKAYKNSIVFHKGEAIRHLYLPINKNEKIFKKLNGMSIKDFGKLLLKNGDPRIMID
tara:strand:+ start:349 stop:1107 length:759 start_codon:yes stop_codon:yes gene_type:complete